MPSPSYFPFLRLPIIIQLLVLKNTRLLELFYFSLTSKKSKQIVKYLKLTISKLTWHFNGGSKYYELKLAASKWNTLSFHVEAFQHDRDPVARFIPFGQFVLDVLSAAEPNNPCICQIQNNLSRNDSLELINQLTKQCLELFEIRNYHLALRRFRNMRDCFLWKYTKQFKSVRVSSCECDCGDDVKFLLEELTTDRLYLGSLHVYGFKYSGSLKIRRFFATNCDWLPLESVLNMDCENFCLACTGFQYKDLNAVIKKWLAGGLNDLKKFKVMCFALNYGASRNSVLDRVLEGIETFPWDIKNRPGRANRYNLEEGRDIRRSDGAIATVDYDLSRNHFDCHFVFHIWAPLSVTN